MAEARNTYSYTAGGNRLSVTHRWNPTPSASVVAGSAVTTSALTQSKKTDYVTNKVYEDGTLKSILIEGGYYDAAAKKYCFYIQDHVGSNRIVADSNGSVIQRNNYYPDGGLFGESTGGAVQPYKYTGKELDMHQGLNLYDYHARQYHPAIGRFTTMDPLAEKYYSISPYAYCENNPVNAVDPDGRDWYRYKDENQDWVYNWSTTIKNQENLDKINSNAEYLGITYKEGENYYGLTGNKYDLSRKEGKVMEKIDEAIINYYDFLNNNREYEKSTNFDIGEYPVKDKFNLTNYSYFSFDAEEGQVTYYKVNPHVPNTAKFGGFGDLNKIRSNSSYTTSGIKTGVTLRFERKTTSSNVHSATILVFPTPKLAEEYYQKVSSILKNRIF